MKFFTQKSDTTTTQDLIDALNDRLFGLEPETSEYTEIMEKLERLHKLQSREKEGKRVSPDTLILVLGNLAGILLILNYERLGIVTSKALSFVLKPR